MSFLIQGGARLLSFKSDSSGDDIEDPESHTGSEGLIVLFTFAGLLLGALLREVNKKTKIPYTPMLLVAGLAIGVYVNELGIFGEATKLALKIEPHGILMIFIPTLIFESAFNADWYIFKKVIINMIVLAGPGVLFGILILSFLLKVIFQYEDDDLTWAGALTLGAIVSTTDPVAVVALLKELGAHAKFNLLIEGESLLNDGVAMVFFSLFLGIIKGEDVSAGDFALKFLQLAGGGPLLGFLAGVIASLWLKRITRDNILSITLTFIACYLLFFFAESWEVSGILALVTLGLFMSAYGKTKIDTEAEGALHAVWTWAQYACETLIFLMTGLLIGREVLFQEESTIELADWIKMIIFYIFLIGSRAAMIFVFLPIIKKHGYGLNGKEFLVLVWGGLRGALGLALALIVAFDDQIPRRMRELILFYTAGMAVLTLIINGTTCSWLVKRLELTVEPEIKHRLQKNLIAEMIIKSQEAQEHLMSDRFLNLLDWNTVKKLVGNEEILKQFQKDPNGSPFMTESHAPPAQENEMVDLTRMIQKRSAYEFFKDDDIFQETRFRILRVMKGIYWEKFEQGLLSGEAARILVEGVNVSLDSTEQPIDMWSFFYEYFTSFKMIKFFMKVKDFFLVGRLAKRYITRHMSFIYEVTTAFIHVSAELIDIGATIPLSKHHVLTVLEEIEKNKSDAENYILDLQDNFLEIIKAIQCQRAANQILNHQRHFLEEMLQTGQIEEKEYAAIRRKIDRKLNSLDNFKIEWHLPTFNEFVVEFPIFSNLSLDDARSLQKDSTQVNFHKGDFVYEVGTPCPGVYFVTKGRLLETLGPRKTFSRGVGAILSFANMVNEERRAVTNCEAFSDVQTTFVPFDKLDPIMKRNVIFEEKIYKNALYTYLQAYLIKENGTVSLDETKVNEILRQCKLLTVKEGERFKLRNGGFLFTGAIIKAVSDEENAPFRSENFSIVKPNNSELCAVKLCKILEFNEEVKEFIDIGSEEVKRSFLDPRDGKASVKLSFREAFQRDIFDKEFKNMINKHRDEDYLS